MRTITKKYILAGLLLAALVGPARTECFGLTPEIRSLPGNILVFITTFVSVCSFFNYLDGLIDHKLLEKSWIEDNFVTKKCEKYSVANITIKTEVSWKKFFIRNMFGRNITKSLHHMETISRHVFCDGNCSSEDKKNCPFLKNG